MNKRKRHSFKTDSDAKADWIKVGVDDVYISDRAIELLQLSKKGENLLLLTQGDLEESVALALQNYRSGLIDADDLVAFLLPSKLEEGGPGSGWFAPPKGTHGKGAKPQKGAAENRLGLGPGEVGFVDDVAPADFAQTLSKHLPKKYRPFVTEYSPEEYREMKARCFISESGQSGFALKPDGDIISVFSSPDVKEGRWAMMSAIDNGGTKLDCFEGFLSDKFYPQFGFKEYERWAWDEQYAPEGWDHDKYNHPSIILMQLED